MIGHVFGDKATGVWRPSVEAVVDAPAWQAAGAAIVAGGVSLEAAIERLPSGRWRCRARLPDASLAAGGVEVSLRPDFETARRMAIVEEHTRDRRIDRLVAFEVAKRIKDHRLRARRMAKLGGAS